MTLYFQLTPVFTVYVTTGVLILAGLAARSGLGTEVFTRCFHRLEAAGSRRHTRPADFRHRLLGCALRRTVRRR